MPNQPWLVTATGLQGAEWEGFIHASSPLVAATFATQQGLTGIRVWEDGCPRRLLYQAPSLDSLEEVRRRGYRYGPEEAIPGDEAETAAEW